MHETINNGTMRTEEIEQEIFELLDKFSTNAEGYLQALDDLEKQAVNPNAEWEEKDSVLLKVSKLTNFLLQLRGANYEHKISNIYARYRSGL